MTDAPFRRHTRPANQPTSRHVTARTWLLWLAGALAFPIVGLAGTAVAGRVDDAFAALVGGTVAGLVLGAGQALVGRRRLDPRRWIPATAAGMGVGLLLGAWTVGYGTSLTDLALMGALTGVALGPAQALALPTQAAHRWMWAAAMPAMWALGWSATTLGGIHVEQQFTIFGAYGALAFSAVSGTLLHRLLPYRDTTQAPPTANDCQARAAMRSTFWSEPLACAPRFAARVPPMSQRASYD